jgi:hypothetical protein
MCKDVNRINCYKAPLSHRHSTSSRQYRKHQSSIKVAEYNHLNTCFQLYIHGTIQFTIEQHVLVPKFSSPLLATEIQTRKSIHDL